jgi:hypothetical protein
MIARFTWTATMRLSTRSSWSSERC